MKCQKFRKKAISPLISTIILLGFAIGLGGFVISWGKTNLPGEIMDCSKASISLVTVKGKPLLCGTSGSIQATVENDGLIPLSGIKVSLVAEKDSFSSAIEKQFPIAEATKIAFNIPPTLGKIQKALFTPMFSLQGNVQICPKQGFDAENIEVC